MAILANNGLELQPIAAMLLTLLFFEHNLGISSGATPDENPKGTRFNRAGPGVTTATTVLQGRRGSRRDCGKGPFLDGN
ncbi:MAG: hypothetical protein B6I30_02650 [Desulfobacteraceae bacterium 4572_187]|nr:MAG: hypothetical protein B6I30_02650 [Desulfobacteraceae bacterium 4572_187]RLB83065.1 MAG: hypothetical protein DRH24_07240 [Deltaproteobacteria bacterium]